MCPEEGSRKFPLRPRFSWDIKAVPWTDGIGDKYEYFKAVDRCIEFFGNLPESNSNKKDQKIQELSFSQIYMVERKTFAKVYVLKR